MGGWKQVGRAWRLFLGWSIVRRLWVFWSWQMFDADILPGGVPALPLLGHWQRTLFLQLFLPISLCFSGNIFTLCGLSQWEFHYSSRSSWTEIKAVPGQLQESRVHLVHREEKLAWPFPWQTLDAQAYPSPALSWLSQHRLAFFRMSQTLVQCVPKTKIKVSEWFHWCSLSIMWQTSPHVLQRKHFRRLCSLEKTSLNPISSPFFYPQCEWEASIRTFFSLVFAGFCFLEPRSNFQFHILIDIPWYRFACMWLRWNRLIRWNCISPV